MTDATEPTVTYFAVSIFSSRTFWLNALAVIIASLSAADVITIIPLRFLPLAAALVAVANIILRALTVRPVALIAPGTSAPVVVSKLKPASTSAITD